MQYRATAETIRCGRTNDRHSRTLGVRRERVRTKIQENIGRRSQDRCHLRMGTTVKTEPLPLKLARLEEPGASLAVLFDYCRAHADDAAGRTRTDGPVDVGKRKQNGKSDKNARGAAEKTTPE